MLILRRKKTRRTWRKTLKACERSRTLLTESQVRRSTRGSVRPDLTSEVSGEREHANRIRHLWLILADDSLLQFYYSFLLFWLESQDDIILWNMFYLKYFQDAGLKMVQQCGLYSYIRMLDPTSYPGLCFNYTDLNPFVQRPGSSPRSNSPFRKRSMPPMRHMLSFQCLSSKSVTLKPSLYSMRYFIFHWLQVIGQATVFVWSWTEARLIVRQHANTRR